MVAELVKVTAKERNLLEQCQDFLSTLAAMQVSERLSGEPFLHCLLSRFFNFLFIFTNLGCLDW